MFATRPIWLLLAFLAGLLAFELLLGLCVQEDAFISFRYAGNLIAGHGLVFNPGERVEGYTNFLWTTFLAGGMALGLDPVPLSRYLGMISSLALVVLVYLLARREDRPRRVSGGLLAAAVVAASPAVAGEGVQGLETVFFAWLVTAGVWLGCAARQREASGRTGGMRRHLAAAVLLALAALTRPEGIGVFGLMTVSGLVWRRRQGLPLLSRGEVGSVLLFLLVYLPYWFWRFDYYGFPLPNTFYAKTGGGFSHMLRGLRYVTRFLRLNPLVTVLTLSALAAGFRQWGRRTGAGEPARRRDVAGPLALVAGSVVVGYLLYVIVIGGDFKKTFRFIVPVLPLWALLLDAAISRHGWLPWPGGRKVAPRLPGDGRRWAATSTAYLVLAMMILNALVSAPATARWARRRAWDLTRRTAVGNYLADHARPEAVLAIHSAGIIPFYCGLRTIDMWGLNDLHIGHRRMPDMGRSRPAGHEKLDLAYVFARRPTYFVDEFHYAVGDSIPDLKARVFPLDPEARALVKDYQVRNVPLLLDDGQGLNRYWFNFLELPK